MNYNNPLILDLTMLSHARAALSRGDMTGAEIILAPDPVMAPGIARARTTSLDIKETPGLSGVRHINLDTQIKARSRVLLAIDFAAAAGIARAAVTDLDLMKAAGQSLRYQS